jgi:hypothetical protein
LFLEKKTYFFFFLWYAEFERFFYNYCFLLPIGCMEKWQIAAKPLGKNFNFESNES